MLSWLGRLPIMLITVLSWLNSLPLYYTFMLIAVLSLQTCPGLSRDCPGCPLLSVVVPYKRVDQRVQNMPGCPGVVPELPRGCPGVVPCCPGLLLENASSPHYGTRRVSKTCPRFSRGCPGCPGRPLANAVVPVVSVPGCPGNVPGCPGYPSPYNLIAVLSWLKSLPRYANRRALVAVDPPSRANRRALVTATPSLSC